MRAARHTLSLPLAIQRTLVDKLAALEMEVRGRSKKEQQKEQQEADAPIVNPGGFGNRLLLTQGNGYGLVTFARSHC